MNRILLSIACLAVACLHLASGQNIHSADRPNIVLVMADDQGWGEVGYRNHPVLKTPNLDAMAAHGLRFDRFYAGAPVCSPTRASVLTGRSNMRTGVNSHGYALRKQETTIAQILAERGYATGHFGKWHLNGMRGPGVPILDSDSHNPGVFGFQTWLSVTNFFDRDPILSRQGKFEEFSGDSSEIVVDEALKFIAIQAQAKRPSFSVIWFGTPHSPFRAADEDMAEFRRLNEKSRNHYGELVALDRSIGTLRNRLRELGIAEDTLFWYCSDNGGLPEISPKTTGGLRGFKGSLYEGGIRVPAIIEFPSRIARPRVTDYPAVTMDIVPTLLEVLGESDERFVKPQDGVSLVQLFDKDVEQRSKAIPFHCLNQTAIIENNLKLLLPKNSKKFELYDLKNDPQETTNLIGQIEELAPQLETQFLNWQKSMESSVAGSDYPERKVLAENPDPRFWTEVEAYRAYFDDWRDRPEYRSRLKGK